MYAINFSDVKFIRIRIYCSSYTDLFSEFEVRNLNKKILA